MPWGPTYASLAVVRRLAGVVGAVLVLLVLAVVAVFAGGWLFAWPLVRPLDPLYDNLARQVPRPLPTDRLQRRILKASIDRISVGINGGVIAPTSFEVRLAPEDIETLGGLTEFFARELGGAIADAARDKGAAAANRAPDVSIVEDPSVAISRPVVSARFETPTQLAPSWDVAEPTVADAGTVVLATWALVPVVEGVPHDAGAIRLTGTEMVVGRSRDVDARLDDPTVSSRHVRLRSLADGRWEVTDLGSTNGTRLNGDALSQPAPMSEGDELRIGSTTWRVARR